MKCVNKNKSWKPLKYAWISTFQSAKNEESLSTALQTLKDQVNHKRSSMNEQISHLESLREEVSWCQFSKVWKTEKRKCKNHIFQYIYMIFRGWGISWTPLQLQSTCVTSSSLMWKTITLISVVLWIFMDFEDFFNEVSNLVKVCLVSAATGLRNRLYFASLSFDRNFHHDFNIRRWTHLFSIQFFFKIIFEKERV